MNIQELNVALHQFFNKTKDGTFNVEFLDYKFLVARDGDTITIIRQENERVLHKKPIDYEEPDRSDWS
jgi:hypothetical protein